LTLSIFLAAESASFSIPLGFFARFKLHARMFDVRRWMFDVDLLIVG